MDGPISSEMQKLFLVLMMTLPGTPVFSNSDEFSQTTVSRRQHVKLHHYKNVLKEKHFILLIAAIFEPHKLFFYLLLLSTFLRNMFIFLFLCEVNHLHRALTSTQCQINITSQIHYHFVQSLLTSTVCITLLYFSFRINSIYTPRLSSGLFVVLALMKKRYSMAASPISLLTPQLDSLWGSSVHGSVLTSWCCLTWVRSLTCWTCSGF